MFRFLSICFALVASCLPALAQTGQPIKQSGSVTPGHPLVWVTNGIAGDGGTAANGFLTSVGVIAQGSGICQSTASPTAPGHQRICLGVNDSSAATITLQNFGIDTPQGLNFVINGVTYPFPYTVGGIVGPNSSTSGDLACWNNTTGSLLKDCGTLGTGIVYGPNSSTANDVPVFSDTTGLLLEDSGYGFRKLLAATTNFYVNNSTGNDSNDCLAATSSGGHAPCATINHTVNVARNLYDIGGQSLPVVNVATGTGTYAEQISISGATIGGGAIQVTGSGSGNVTIQAPPGLYAVLSQSWAGIQFTGFTFGCASGAAGEWLAAKRAQIDAVSDIKFTGCAGQAQITAITGSQINLLSAVTFSGNAGAIVSLDSGTLYSPSVTHVISGSPTYMEFLSVVGSSYVAMSGGSVTGTFTGLKFACAGPGWIEGGASGSPNSFISGGSNGTLTQGCQDDNGDAQTSVYALKAASVTNAQLANPATTVDGQTCTLGATCTTTIAAQSDYAATTWTPTITTTSTVGTPAYTTHVGSYEQLGRQITVRFNITLSGWSGSPTGDVEIAGLPVAAANVSNDYGICMIANYSVTGLAASNIGITGLIAPNTSAIILYQSSNTASSLITAAQAGTTPTFVGYCNYHT